MLESLDLYLQIPDNRVLNLEIDSREYIYWKRIYDIEEKVGWLTEACVPENKKGVWINRASDEVKSEMLITQRLFEFYLMRQYIKTGQEITLEETQELYLEPYPQPWMHEAISELFTSINFLPTYIAGMFHPISDTASFVERMKEICISHSELEISNFYEDMQDSKSDLFKMLQELFESYGGIQSAELMCALALVDSGQSDMDISKNFIIPAIRINSLVRSITEGSKKDNPFPLPLELKNEELRKALYKSTRREDLLTSGEQTLMLIPQEDDPELFRAILGFKISRAGMRNFIRCNVDNQYDDYVNNIPVPADARNMNRKMSFIGKDRKSFVLAWSDETNNQEDQLIDTLRGINELELFLVEDDYKPFPKNYIPSLKLRFNHNTELTRVIVTMEFRNFDKVEKGEISYLQTQLSMMITDLLI